MWQRFTERARRVVFFAQEEAGRLGEKYVSTEHLLLGLVREDDSMAPHILDRMGVSLETIRSDIERQVTCTKGVRVCKFTTSRFCGSCDPGGREIIYLQALTFGSDLQLTPRASRAIDLAFDEARQLDNNYLGTAHILLGLIREGKGLAGRVLARLGVRIEQARSEMMALQDDIS